MAYCVQCGAANAGGRFCGQCGTPVAGNANGSISPRVVAEPTTFEKKCEILADLWINHRSDETMQDFVEYNDLGLPLAYAAANGIVAVSPGLEEFVLETFRQLLEAYDLEDEGFDELSEIIE